jgi:hypothetical protein
MEFEDIEQSSPLDAKPNNLSHPDVILKAKYSKCVKYFPLNKQTKSKSAK